MTGDKRTNQEVTTPQIIACFAFWAGLVMVGWLISFVVHP